MKSFFHTENTSSKQLIDFSWYLLGTIIPILVNLIKNPIFTRIFSTEEYGYYSLVFLTYNYLALAIFSWLSSTIWRYYYEYKAKNRLNALFSNIIFIYLIAAIVLFVFSAGWYLTAEMILIKKLIAFSFLYFLINDLIGFYLVIIRLEKKVIEYNLIQSLRAVLNIFTVVVLSFEFHFRIESLVIGFFFSSFLLLVYVIIKVYAHYRFVLPKYLTIDKSLLKMLFAYGLISLFANISALVLSSSDLYVLALYNSMDVVGIYNQNYAIANLGFAALTTAFFNTINPELNKQLTQNNSGLDAFLAKNIVLYFLFFLPVAFYFSLYAFQFSALMLGNDFQSGFKIIPYVVFSMFFYGLASFPETRMKFTRKYISVIMGFSIACIINIVLNLLILKNYHYRWAAITTLIAYLAIFLFFVFKDFKPFQLAIKNYRPVFSISILVLIVQLVVHLYLVSNFTMNLFLLILEGVLFVSFFAFIVLKLNKRYNLFVTNINSCVANAS